MAQTPQFQKMSYRDLVLRNKGYISDATQEKIRNTRVLVAGCGAGSTIAESMVRTGFTKFFLADHDTVSPHNLNRQSYEFKDLNRPKVEALRDRLVSINPDIEVQVCNERVMQKNVAKIVGEIDFVMDTIDFLNLPDVIALHDEAHLQKKPVLSCLTAGWGAAGLYFPSGHSCTARTLFGLPEHGSVEGESYIERFAGIMSALGAHLNPAIVAVFSEALKVMEDGTPCPASQLAVGGASLAALANTLAVRILSGQPVAPAPRIHLVDLDRLAEVGSLTLGDAPSR
jgi:hypothetical protein